MPDETALTVSLAEFGLGKYEAQAYVTLLSKGTISASDLAYYSAMPRTKVYPVLRRLEEKRLATMTRTKPVMCSALAPRESFDELITEQINKVNAMNSLVEELKVLDQGAKRMRGIKMRKYIHINHSEVLCSTQKMIRSADLKICAIVGSSGLGLLSSCSSALAFAARKGVKIMILVNPSAIGTVDLRNISRIGNVRISEIEQNNIVLDDSSVMIVGGKAGKAALFENSAIQAAEQMRLFDSVWKNAVNANPLIVIPKNIALDAYRVICIVQKIGLARIFDSKITSSASVLDFFNDNGLCLRKRTLDDIVAFIDVAVHATCSGSVSHDSKSSKILVASELNSGHSRPWARIIEAYLDESGIKSSTLYQKRPRHGEQIHIKMG